MIFLAFFFSSRRRHTRCGRDWSSDVCSSDLPGRLHAAVASIARERDERAPSGGLLHACAYLVNRVQAVPSPRQRHRPGGRHRHRRGLRRHGPGPGEGPAHPAGGGDLRQSRLQPPVVPDPPLRVLLRRLPERPGGVPDRGLRPVLLRGQAGERADLAHAPAPVARPEHAQVPGVPERDPDRRAALRLLRDRGARGRRGRDGHSGIDREAWLGCVPYSPAWGTWCEGRDRLMEQGYSLPAEFDRLQAPSSAYAPRQVITYLCTREHLVTVPFAVEVEVPEVWECRCGQPATRIVEEDEASSATAE